MTLEKLQRHRQEVLREILEQGKVWKRRNTSCISSFQTAALRQKIRQDPQTMASELLSKDYWKNWA